MDCCTFDRVLLYLQHARRGEAFKFDPTLAPELLTASESLKIRGLEDCCRRVLGSFDERVRKAPIRYSEVVERNARGGKTDPRAAARKAVQWSCSCYVLQEDGTSIACF